MGIDNTHHIQREAWFRGKKRHRYPVRVQLRLFSFSHCFCQLAVLESKRRGIDDFRCSQNKYSLLQVARVFFPTFSIVEQCNDIGKNCPRVHDAYLSTEQPLCQ